jgi:multiple sugar transport system permease protein
VTATRSDLSIRHGSGAATRRRRRFWQLPYSRRLQLWGIGFVLPSLLFFMMFRYGPMIWAIELSFTSYDMVSEPRFVGLENYRWLWSDPIFWKALSNTLVYIVGSTVLITLVGLALALAIHAGPWGSRQAMGAMFLTNLMPIIAVAMVWKFLLHPHGVITQLLPGIHSVPWLTSSQWAMPSIIGITVWRFAPYFMVVFLAALLAIPRDYYEAAQLDGANAVRRFFKITLPLLMPTMFFVVVISALLSARIFLLPYIVTGGGPGHETRVLSMLIFETGFSYMKMGQAAAISVVLFAIMLVFTLLQMRLFMGRERVYAP